MNENYTVILDFSSAKAEIADALEETFQNCENIEVYFSYSDDKFMLDRLDNLKFRNPKIFARYENDELVKYTNYIDSNLEFEVCRTEVSNIWNIRNYIYENYFDDYSRMKFSFFILILEHGIFLCSASLPTSYGFFMKLENDSESNIPSKYIERIIEEGERAEVIERLAQASDFSENYSVSVRIRAVCNNIRALGLNSTSEIIEDLENLADEINQDPSNSSQNNSRIIEILSRFFDIVDNKTTAQAIVSAAAAAIVGPGLPAAITFSVCMAAYKGKDAFISAIDQVGRMGKKNQ